MASLAVRHFEMSRRGGFSILEVLLAVVVLVWLFALVVPALHGIADDSRNLRCLKNLQHIGIYCSLYLADYKCFPPGEGDGGNPFFPHLKVATISGISNVSGVYVDISSSPQYRGDVDNKPDYFYNPQAFSDFGPHTSYALMPKPRKPADRFMTIFGGNQIRSCGGTELVRDLFNDWTYSNAYSNKGLHRRGAAINVLYMDSHVESKLLVDPDISPADAAPAIYQSVWGYDTTNSWY